jgi:predicted ATPase
VPGKVAKKKGVSREEKEKQENHFYVAHIRATGFCELEDRKMLNNPQYPYRFTELDPDLLSTPFRVQTNWHVITGAPCSGKTTLIDQLANQGFQTVPEIARVYIKREIDKGQTIHSIRANAAALQRGITDMQLSVESGLRANDVLFLDGAVPGSLSWARVFGPNPNELLPECFHHRYASVFVLAPLPFQADDQRIEEMDAIAGYLDEWLTRDYSALGYRVVRVPVLPPEERLAFVLERLSEQGMI